MSSDRFLVETLYRNSRRIVSGVAPDGAVGVNAEWESDPSRHWYIEEQRYGADLIQLGLATGNGSAVDEGVRVINWGFAHEGAGGFPGTGDPHHSISFFLEAASRSVILLQQAGDERHLAQLHGWRKNLRNAAAFLMTPDVFPKDRSTTMDPYTHRFFLCAAALGEAGSVLGDRALGEAALAMARAGLERQEPDGTNPEKGGFDVNYQAVGVLFGIRYLLVSTDPDVRAALSHMIPAALEREKSEIDENGDVSTEGSTRLTSEAARSGRPKTMDYKTLAQAFIYWADIGGDASFREPALAVARNRHW